jgi:hypothetical protein
MQQEEVIVILLAIALLSICYFSPLTSSTMEGFKNYNPQGSYSAPKNFNPGSAVELTEFQANTGVGSGGPNNQKFPGPPRSLNLKAGTPGSFPYLEQSKSGPEDDVISLIKSDGVILGGYVPQIIRPFDTTVAQTKNDKCSWPCYSDLKHQKWCSEENAINYYAMRPLVSPSKYNANLLKMFKQLADKNGPPAAKVGDLSYTAIFCTESKESLMSWLMQRIAKEVSVMPEMKRNGSWKTERFYDTDVQMFQYINPDGTVHFKVIFNLYNPLRSVATLVVANIYVVKGKPLIENISFVNEGEMTDYTPPMNGFGPINGANISTKPKSGSGIEEFNPLGTPDTPLGMKKWESEYKKNPNEFDWNYKNTLEVQKFNQYGFYSNVPGDNVEIKGGIPESLKKPIKECKEEDPLSCILPGFSGVAAVSAKALGKNSKKIDKSGSLGGSVKNIYANPNIVYSVPTNSIRHARVETKPIGLVYH